ncbi:MAG: RagB/SusD family nutrient uptake outer membrane protein [Chitinophaga sp.]|uniref:RagB/SusD family nutrient uptake outer membrane protein n=1 Tax=Chitinophaga sp. TaxID=1869181 RepID=UPI0025B98521|nr:RagB/SusD family nutrient uptake outer membrane protein [Chitinophaga sp.]MBV8251908.1 RagB/SusD family nutrient uptake outer membrane protein [Chitinophaga sp.]
MQRLQRNIVITSSLVLLGMLCACKKLVTIPDPINTISTGQVFSSEKQANSAMAGVYSKLINGSDFLSVSTIGERSFAAGLSTILGGLSSDELYNYRGTAEQSYYGVNTNNLTILNSGHPWEIWYSAYDAIYGTNSIIEGIAASKATALKDSVRKALTGEAKFVRAFSYFYLVNFFGDVPLALSIDFNQTSRLPRAPQDQVYQQMLQDLKDAAASMPASYPTSTGERTRPNKYAALAMLARVYLYMGDYTNAAATATQVINNGADYTLESDLNNVFRKSSREAIWQLQQTLTDFSIKDATPEGFIMQPNILKTGIASFCLTPGLLATFEPGDQRLPNWTDSTDNSAGTGTSPGMTYYPGKYKIGKANGTPGMPPQAYYLVLRLAEMYLIRAEAAANGAAGGIGTAIADLNMIRNRAGLPALSAGLNKEQALAAVAKERRTELFGEWGHRWFDLKRTKQMHAVLSVLPLKQPWQGDYQAVYPLPVPEISANHYLIQNTGY